MTFKKKPMQSSLTSKFSAVNVVVLLQGHGGGEGSGTDGTAIKTHCYFSVFHVDRGPGHYWSGVRWYCCCFVFLKTFVRHHIAKPMCTRLATVLVWKKYYATIMAPRRLTSFVLTF